MTETKEIRRYLRVLGEPTEAPPRGIQHRDKGGDTWRDVNGRGSFVQTMLDPAVAPGADDPPAGPSASSRGLPLGCVHDEGDRLVAQDEIARRAPCFF